MKIEISMSEDFAYFSIFTKSYNRFISISRHQPYIKTMDVKHYYKTKKNYFKTSYINKWQEVKPFDVKAKEELNKFLQKLGLNKFF